MKLKRSDIHKYIYIFSLSLLAASIPLSEYLTSISQFLLALNWLTELEFKNKFKRLWNNKPVLCFFIILIIHLIWTVPSDNIDYALKDIRIKLPLFVIPLIISTSRALEYKHIKTIMIFFISALVAGSLIGIAIFMGFGNMEIHDSRNLSIFISHIRFALLINLGIATIAYFIIDNNNIKLKNYEYYIYIPVALLLFSFLVILKSMTGLVIFVVLFTIFIYYLIRKIKNKKIKYTLTIILLIMILIPSYHTFVAIQSFNKIKNKEISPNLKTKQGNDYKHYPDRIIVENSRYIWRYVSENEMQNAWNKRANIKYYGKDIKNQTIKYTLVRYLTSKGYKKDAEGVSKLTEQDVKNIESGIANHIYANKYSLYTNIYKIIWELDVYFKTKYANNHSITQRFIYLDLAFDIIEDNFWFGVGTGDVQDEFNKIYAVKDTKLEKKHHRRAHNQLITFFLTFGVFGFIIIVICFLYPFIKQKRKDILLYAFMIIFILSMLNEDTLETQTGATFFAFFYSFLLYARKNNLEKLYNPN